MAQRCIIAGAGGHGRVVLDILRLDARLEVVGFVDSNADLHGRRVDGRPVLGTMDDLPALRHRHGLDAAVVAIGDNGTRREFADRVTALGLECVNAIHPSANIAGNVTLGTNLVIAAGALVSAHCHIGDSAILNTGSIVDHESMIGPGAHVCPGARLAGRVTVGAGAFVGIGATVIQCLKIGSDAIVGAGAVVIRDVAAMTTVVGVPAVEVQRVADSEYHARWILPEVAQLRRAVLERIRRTAGSTLTASESVKP